MVEVDVRNIKIKKKEWADVAIIVTTRKESMEKVIDWAEDELAKHLEEYLDEQPTNAPQIDPADPEDDEPI